jgi:hypothetical protein
MANNDVMGNDTKINRTPQIISFMTASAGALILDPSPRKPGPSGLG